ncbi:hypothetical protein VUJ46_00960 [Chryseobacterium sp. MYb264]|uniref:hypothetical protein n=1 Tax=Chryseobacterium sp. MYb264 TaxID=2745153 RepID=UPI002E14D40E|nr:hypothetical protein VUJ46_00960 [Chryseobacterium sp. MYb264]
MRKNRFYLLLIVLLINYQENKSQIINKKAFGIVSNIPAEKRVTYAVHVNALTPYELYLDDILIDYFYEDNMNNTTELNPYLLENGKHKLKIRYLPTLKDMFSKKGLLDPRDIYTREDSRWHVFFVKLNKDPNVPLGYTNEIDYGSSELKIIPPPSQVPYWEQEWELDIKDLPYKLKGWSESEDLSKMDKDQLKKEVVTFFEQQRNLLNEGKVDDYLKLGIKKYETVTVAQVQKLTPADYTIDEASDSITLNLKYNYNKSYSNEIARYLLKEQNYLSGGILNDNIKNLWVVRYLLSWVKSEPLEQTYFVPVTTCRYPNQMAKIRVFPDMKWVLNFNYNIDTPIYYKASTALETYYSGYNEGTIRDADGNERPIVTANSTRRGEIIDSNITNMLQRNTGRLTSFGLSVECEVSGQDDVINIGKDFAEKYRQMLSPFFRVINFLDGALGVTEARTERNNQRIAPSTSRGFLERLNKYPWSFELKSPSLGVGLGIGYASSKNGTITYELDGRLIADPLIGAEVRIDILALGSKFKPWGAIIDALNIASWLTNVISGGDVELKYDLYFQLSAQINLVGTGTKDGETKPANITYNFADKKYEGDIALQGILEGDFVASISLEIYVKKKNRRSFEAQYSNEEDKKKAAKFGLSVEGKSFVTLSIGKNFGEEDNWDSDFYFSGFTLKVIFNAGIEKKQPEPLQIIPKIDATIDVLKGKFEIK